LITIATFNRLEEAQLILDRLAEVGIAAHVQDENIVQTKSGYPYVVGAVCVQIARVDVATMERLLGFDVSALALKSTPEVFCPSCGSSQTALEESPRQYSFLNMFTFPVLGQRFRWRCATCDYTFRIES
jgi:rubredoxin